MKKIIFIVVIIFMSACDEAGSSKVESKLPEFTTGNIVEAFDIQDIYLLPKPKLESMRIYVESEAENARGFVAKHEENTANFLLRLIMCWWRLDREKGVCWDEEYAMGNVSLSSGRKLELQLPQYRNITETLEYLDKVILQHGDQLYEAFKVLATWNFFDIYRYKDGFYTFQTFAEKLLAANFKNHKELSEIVEFEFDLGKYRGMFDRKEIKKYRNDREKYFKKRSKWREKDPVAIELGLK